MSECSVSELLFLGGLGRFLGSLVRQVVEEQRLPDCQGLLGGRDSSLREPPGLGLQAWAVRIEILLPVIPPMWSFDVGVRASVPHWRYRNWEGGRPVDRTTTGSAPVCRSRACGPASVACGQCPDRRVPRRTSRPHSAELRPLVSRPPLRAISRDTVDDGRSMRSAIVRADSPAAIPREISSRSSRDR